MSHEVIVLFGGRSDERHVSVASAQSMVKNLGTGLAWFWAPNGAVHDVNRAELLAHQNPFEADYIPSRPALWPDLEQALDTLPVADPVFLMALHGGEGEDGRVQALMERRGIAYSGSNSEASAAAFDKGQAKERVRGLLKMAESQIAGPAEIADAARELLERHPKIVLKPLAGGSSRGLFFAERSDDMARIAADAAASGVSYVLEEFVAGRELAAGVADLGEGPVALPIIEIEVDDGFAFDYAGKYLGSGTREICPAKVPDSVRDDAQRTALAAHQALGCEGYSRSDLIIGEDGVYFLEINTLPGLTASSLLPQELREAGVEMKTFLERQVELALQRRDATGATGFSPSKAAQMSKV